MEKQDSVKDKIADIVRAQGYDFLTAYEEASRVIKDMKDKAPGKYWFNVGQARFQIVKS